MFSPFFKFPFKKIYTALPTNQDFLKFFKIRIRMFNYGGTILSTSYNQIKKASLTIEATIILPFFLLLLYVIVFFMQLVGLQLSLQMQLEETARKINSSPYLLHNEMILIEPLFFTDEITALCDTFISHGSNGVSFGYSNYNTEKQQYSIVMTYFIKFPLLSSEITSLHFVQKCHFKLWNGLHDTTALSEDDPFVYLTNYGSVYHTDKYCSHLIKYSNIIPYSELDTFCMTQSRDLRVCSVCNINRTPTNSSLIYITSTGDTYHLSKDCYYLYRNICQCKKSSLPATLNACSKCSE